MWWLLIRLVDRLVPRSQRDEVLGDLLEERWRRRRQGQGVQLWALLEAGNLIVHGIRTRGLRSGSAAVGSLVETGSLLQDARLAVRALVRSPGYTVVVAATLAIGIGASTGLFALVHGVLIQPLPFAEPERLVRVGERPANAAPDRVWSISPANFDDLDAAVRTLESLAAYRLSAFALSGDAPPERLRGQRVTHDFFEVLGMPMALGRGFAAHEDSPGGDPVVVLGPSLWRDRFGARDDVLEETIVLDGEPHRVVGVLASDPPFPGEPRLWVPFAFSDSARAQRRGRSIEAIGRLGPGVSLEAARAELGTLFSALAEEYPEVNADRGVGSMRLGEWLLGPTAPRRLLLLSLAALLVLALAAINVLHLGLARGATRRGELAIRSALGAGGLRLVRLQVLESLLVAVSGAVLGLWLAGGGVQLLAGSLGQWIPRVGEVRIDTVAVGWALGVAVVIGVVVGGFPALTLRRGDGLSRLAADGGPTGSGRSRGRSALVVAEVALALILVVAAGLLLRSLWRLTAVDLGIEAEGALAFTIDLPAGEDPDREAFLEFYDRVAASLATIPGVTAVGAQNRTLLQGGGNAPVARIDGREFPGERLVEVREILPGLFDALGIPLVTGRVLGPADRDGGPVAVVNETFVRSFLDGEGPLGRSFALSEEGRSFRVVGVVGDVRDHGPASPAPPIAYFPFGNGPWPSWPYLVFALRAEEPLDVVPAARARVAEIDPLVPLANVATVESIARERLGSSRRAAGLLFGIFAVVAVLLGGSGIYAVTAHAVIAATHDYGIRRAVGATPGDVRRMILAQGLRRALAGAAIGCLGAAALARSLSSLLFEVDPLEPMTFAVAVGGIVTVSLLACELPARRAAAVDPVRALRHGG